MDGEILKTRMNLLGYNKIQLAEESLVDLNIIEKILDNKLSFKELDLIDVSFLSQVLKCDSNYFLDENIRKQDILNKIGTDNVKTNRIMATINCIAEDFEFMIDIANKIK